MKKDEVKERKTMTNLSDDSASRLIETMMRNANNDKIKDRSLEFSDKVFDLFEIENCKAVEAIGAMVLVLVKIRLAGGCDTHSFNMMLDTMRQINKAISKECCEES